jgi:hypothetical protein
MAKVEVVGLEHGKVVKKLLQMEIKMNHTLKLTIFIIVLLVIQGCVSIF